MDINPSAVINKASYTTKNSSDQFTETVKNLSARVVQTVFTAGIFFSVRSSLIAASAVLSGGSFLLHGTFVLYSLFEGALCYDISRLAANFASIHDSPVLRNWTEKTFGKTAAKVVKTVEDFFAVPTDLLVKSKVTDAGYVKAATTHQTIFLRYGESYFSDLLSWKNGGSAILDTASQTPSQLKSRL